MSQQKQILQPDTQIVWFGIRGVASASDGWMVTQVTVAATCLLASPERDLCTVFVLLELCEYPILSHKYGHSQNAKAERLNVHLLFTVYSCTQTFPAAFP